MSYTMVRCLYEGRSQGSLTRGVEYKLIEIDRDKRRLRVEDNKGLPKWYARSRFNWSEVDPRMFSVPVYTEHEEPLKIEPTTLKEVIDTMTTSAPAAVRKTLTIDGDMLEIDKLLEMTLEEVIPIVRGKSPEFIAKFKDAVRAKKEGTYTPVGVHPEVKAPDHSTSFVKTAKEELDKRIKEERASSASYRASEREVEDGKKKATIRSFLESQGVMARMIQDIVKWREEHKLDTNLIDRVIKPTTLFLGKDAWVAGIAAILEGQHLLLEGVKATGKNVLANNLAFVFNRPSWDISFHVHTDASSLIGGETFKGGEVKFRPGAVYQCAALGGFGILDEINMAKNEAIAVLHSTLDDRRVIDVPGYERVSLHPATRFIGTMNYGYAGTRELNEALASRFVIVNIPQLTNVELERLIKMKFPTVQEDKVQYWVGIFSDLQTKALNAEITTKSVDLRGIIASLKLIHRGMKPLDALKVSVVNKAFDDFERKIVSDVVSTRITSSWTTNDIFTS